MDEVENTKEEKEAAYQRLYKVFLDWGFTEPDASHYAAVASGLIDGDIVRVQSDDEDDEGEY